MRNGSEAQLVPSGKKRPTDNELKNLYEKEKRPTTFIGELYGVSLHAVSQWLKNAEIPMRNGSEAQLAEYNGERPSNEDLEQMYVHEQLTTTTIAKRCRVSIGTVCRWLKKVGIERRGRYFQEQPKYSLEEAMVAYVRYTGKMNVSNETPVSVDTFFEKYDPTTLQPAKGNPPLRTYLRSYQNKNLEARTK